MSKGKTFKRPKRSTKPKRRRTRLYDNSTRIEKSQLTQQKIIETLVTLLVERKGGEIQMDELAAKSGISERTLFRFFKDKQTLHKAVDDYLNSYMQASVKQLDTMDFVGFLKNSFVLFDKNESLVMAYLFSSFGHETRKIFRKKLTGLMTSRLILQNKLNMTPERHKRLALMVTMVNAKIWYDLKSDFGYSGEDMGPTLEWAMQLLLKDI